MNTDSNDLNREEIRAEENAVATDTAEENEEEKKKRVLPGFWLKKALIVCVALLSLFLICFTAFWWKPWNGKAPDVTAETSSAEEASEAVLSGSKGEEISAAEPAGPSSYSSPYEAPSTDERPPAAKSAATPRQPNINSERQESSGEVSEAAAVQTQAPTPAPAPTPEPTPAPAPAPTPAPEPTPAPAPVHTHTWVHHDAVTHTVHHDATYSTVHHDTVTEQRYVEDTPGYWVSTWYCACGAAFGSQSEWEAHAVAAKLENPDVSHSCSTHEQYVEGTGHYETVTVSEAYDETVETSPAWDETIVDSPAYDECSGCGARQ